MSLKFLFLRLFALQIFYAVFDRIARCEAVKSQFKIFLIFGEFMKHVCKICGYIYDDSVESMPFDELPADWVCPVCGASKADFEVAE